MKDLYDKTLGIIDLYTFVNGMHHFRLQKNITKDSLHALFYIQYCEMEVTPKLLAQYLQVSKPRVSNIITPLLKKGYLMNRPSTSDKRSFSLLITKEGSEYLQNSLQDLYHLHDALINEIGFGDYIQLVELCKRSSSIFKKGKK